MAARDDEDTMPRIGEIKSGGKGVQKRIYLACPQCGKERWVALPSTKRPDYTGLCHQCNALVRGGNRIKQGYRGRQSNGYIVLKLQPDNFFYSMSGKDGYVLEHRLVMAKYLGRCLHLWEIVHHKNHKRDDNRIENLQLVTDDRHKQISILEAKIERLQKGNRELKAKLKALEKGRGEQ